MAIWYTANTVLLIRTRNCININDKIILVCCFNLIQLRIITSINIKMRLSNSCNSLGYFWIISTIWIQIITTYFCPNFFKHSSPYRWSIFSCFSKQRYVILRVLNWIYTFIIIHVQIVVDCYCPRSSSYIEIDCIYRCIVFCLCKKGFFYNSRKFSTRRYWRDEIAVSKVTLNILVEIYWSISWKQWYIWPSIWPSLPKISFLIPLSNKSWICKSIPP